MINDPFCADMVRKRAMTWSERAMKRKNSRYPKGIVEYLTSPYRLGDMHLEGSNLALCSHCKTVRVCAATLYATTCWWCSRHVRVIMFEHWEPLWRMIA